MVDDEIYYRNLLKGQSDTIDKLKEANNSLYEKIKKLKIQQKEFINYLQEELNVQIQEESIGVETINKRYILEEILQKYKEIIDGENEFKKQI